MNEERGAPIVMRAEVESICPDDFVEYWHTVLAEVAPTPVDACVQRVEDRCTDDVITFAVEYTSDDGLRIAGWYCAPNEERCHVPLPGLVLGPGYISDPLVPKSWARLGYAVLSLAPRGKVRSNSAFNPGYPGFLTLNIVDRDTYAYRGAFVDAVRGLDVLLQRPEVDGSRIGVLGSSQGGLLAFVLAALRSEVVRCCASGSPFMCAPLQSARLTHSYPYEEINEFLRAYPDESQRVSACLAYYDGINFARQVTCPTLVYVGELDDVCPPEASLAAFDQLRCEKRLIVTAGAAHDAGSFWVLREVEQFLALHLMDATGNNVGTSVGPR